MEKPWEQLADWKDALESRKSSTVSESLAKIKVWFDDLLEVPTEETGVW